VKLPERTKRICIDKPFFSGHCRIRICWT
jgi:hypothetical protein